jgi:hypothetical protein
MKKLFSKQKYNVVGSADLGYYELTKKIKQ